jgi:protein-tyrosine-phosphatase
VTAPFTPKSVLFRWVANSARSQMAEGLARARFAGRVGEPATSLELS